MRADAAAMVNGVNEGLPQAMIGRPLAYIGTILPSASVTRRSMRSASS